MNIIFSYIEPVCYSLICRNCAILRMAIKLKLLPLHTEFKYNYLQLEIVRKNTWF